MRCLCPIFNRCNIPEFTACERQVNILVGRAVGLHRTRYLRSKNNLYHTLRDDFTRQSHHLILNICICLGNEPRRLPHQASKYYRLHVRKSEIRDLFSLQLSSPAFPLSSCQWIDFNQAKSKNDDESQPSTFQLIIDLWYI